MPRNLALWGLIALVAALASGCGTTTASMLVVKPAPINVQPYGGTVGFSGFLPNHPGDQGAADQFTREIAAGVNASYGGVVRAAEANYGVDIGGMLEYYGVQHKIVKYKARCAVKRRYTDAKGKNAYKTEHIDCEKARVEWRALMSVVVRVQGNDGRMLFQRRMQGTRSGVRGIEARNYKGDLRRTIREIKADIQRTIQYAHQQLGHVRQGLAKDVANLVSPRQVRVSVELYDCKGAAEPVCKNAIKLMTAGRYDDCLAAYDNALQIYAKNPATKNADAGKVHWNRAMAYRFSNRFDEAQQELSKALRLDPGNSTYERGRQIVADAQRDDQALAQQGLVGGNEPPPPAPPEPQQGQQPDGEPEYLPPPEEDDSGSPQAN